MIQNEKVCKVSANDYVKDTEDSLIPDLTDTTDCDYSDEYKVEYYDKYWHYDLGEKIIGKKEWLGSRGIYNYWVLGKYDF